MLVAETFWGRNVFKNLCLNWENLFSVFVCKTSNSELNDLISQYTDVFKSEIGTLKNDKVDTPIDPKAKPCFFQVPYA